MIGMGRYQEQALLTWHTKKFPSNLQRDHAILGVVGEAGELAELHKKDRFKPGHESTAEERLDELGDILYYVAILAYLDGATLADVGKQNIAKLSDGHGWVPDFMKEATP